MDEIILPTPNPPFVWRQTTWGLSLVCSEIEPVAPHLFTTRQWTLGATTQTRDALSGGRPGVDEGGWQDIADAMQVDLRMLARARQVHGSGVLIAEIAPEASPSADIIVTSDARRAVAVSAADCAPILIVDSRTGAVAAAHAGWRGMATGVPVATVEGLVRGYGSRPADLLVAVGPSIGACCYEVGREVREAFGSGRFARESIERLFHEHPSSSGCNPSVPRLVETRRPQHWFFDGWAAVREQLAEAGVPAEQVFVAELCTASHPELFCSFRRDGPPAGRLAAVIKPRSPRP